MAYTADIYSDLIRRMYVEQGLSLRKISSILRMEYSCPASANMIAHVLNTHGIATTKSSTTGCHRLVVCRTCGRPKEIARSRYVESLGRGATPHRPRYHYCDWSCRRVWLEEHCKGQQAARRLVEYLMDEDLPPDAVCHFVDDNSSNVIKQNIRVFTNTKRHLEEHRKERGE
jgi:hypothetical protein